LKGQYELQPIVKVGSAVGPIARGASFLIVLWLSSWNAFAQLFRIQLSDAMMERAAKRWCRERGER